MIIKKFLALISSAGMARSGWQGGKLGSRRLSDPQT
jgi:hypothetical protein